MPANKTPELDMLQIKADIILAEKAVESSAEQNPRFAKYLRGQAAYHVQQAVEKLIKIQLYNSGNQLDLSKIYKHSISSLLSYADDMGIVINVPALIRKNDELVTSWEAEGRYDVHLVVRTDTLRKYIETLKKWYESLEKNF